MKRRFLRWIIGLLAVLIVLLVAVVLMRDVVLKAAAERGIEEETGLRAVIGELQTSLGSGALRLRDLKLYNPADFGGALMAEVPEMFVELNPEQAADGRLHFRDLKLVLTELHIVRNTAGRLNLDGVEKRVRERLHLRRKRKGEKMEFEFAGIDRLHLTVGRVLFTDLKHPQHPLMLDLGLKDEVITGLKTEEDLGKWAGAILFRIMMQLSFGGAGGAPHLETDSPHAGNSE